MRRPHAPAGSRGGAAVDPLSSDLFLGTWILLPELSLYQVGAPPQRGTYVITEHGGIVHFRIDWVPAEGGPERTLSFSGPPDGVVQPASAPAPGAPDSFSVVRVDHRTLDSSAFAAGQVVAYARRIVSSDGELLAVVQQGTAPGQGLFRNFQVYRRRVGAL